MGSTQRLFRVVEGGGAELMMWHNENKVSGVVKKWMSKWGLIEFRIPLFVWKFGKKENKK